MDVGIEGLLAIAFEQTKELFVMYCEKTDQGRHEGIVLIGLFIADLLQLAHETIERLGGDRLFDVGEAEASSSLPPEAQGSIGSIGSLL